MDPVVAIAGGSIRGVERDGILSFSGIPYARPPTGPLRWRAPEPPEAWTRVRDAVAFGPVAPQPPPAAGIAIPGDPVEQSEDCLTANVWTPGLDGGRRPVMVWIHGGGFTSGTGAGLLYRGGHLASRGDVVVVTLNYRLGALGFLAHPDVDEAGGSGARGNWGLLDQVAALRWVRHNISAFGGDPRNVTVFGESAGGMSISALLAMPAARGLFHRAIIQSGPPYTHTLGRARSAAEELASGLGIARITRAALERVPAGDLVAAAQAMQDRRPPPGELPLPFLPVIDGSALPRSPETAVAAGEAGAVPLLIGTNRDEISFFSLGDPEFAGLDDEGLRRWLTHAAPDLPPAETVERYRSVLSARGRPDDPRAVWVAAGSDLVFRWPSLSLAAAQSVHQPATFVYLFTWEAPAFGGMLGSCHALEIPFVFGALHRPVVSAFAGGGQEAEALSLRMQDAWLSFARSGHPSGGVPDGWPAWDPERRATMVFGPGGGVVEGPMNEELEVWERSRPLAG